MKLSYILRYSWQDIWSASNRTFTLINLIAITISISVFIVLAGGFLAFRENGKQMMDQMGLGIEVSAQQERELTPDERSRLQKIKGVSASYTWTPSLFFFYNNQGALRDIIGGRTVDLRDPLLSSLRDIRGDKPVRFLDKGQLKHKLYDELGLIVPFVMLKQLAYLPPTATVDKPDSWKQIPLPNKLSIRIKSRDGTPAVVGLPIVGIVADLEGGRYLVTKDCDQIFGNQWRDEYRPFLQDRHGGKLFPQAMMPADKSNPLAKRKQNYVNTHATVYAQGRDEVLPLLQLIRGELSLKADCALEYYLEDYKQQETFFIAAVGGICLVMFFFSGVVLFATFQALILRKTQEIGILKACGSSKILVYVIFALQALLISALSVIFGVSIGLGAGWKLSSNIQKALQLKKGQWFVFPPEYLALLFGLSLLFCLLVTFFPVRMAVKVDPDRVMRT